MHNISLAMETLTASSFGSAQQTNPDLRYLTPARPRPPLRRLRLLLVSTCAIVATACATLSAPSEDQTPPPAQADLDAIKAEAADAVESAEAARSEAEADAAQARAEAAAARQEADQARAEAATAQEDADQALMVAQEDADRALMAAQAAMADKAAAMADAEAAKADADAAMAAADDSAAEAAAAQAKVDAMMAADYQPSEVMVSADMLDPGMVNLDQVQVSLAGPDSIYVSNIRYGGVPYSALLKYTGGTSATVKAVYGPMGKLIPDSVGLAQTELDFMAPASLAVSNVSVGGVGYSGTLEYAGGDQLRVKDIRRVTLPPTAAEAAAAAIAQAENDAAAAVSAAQAAADMAMADAEAAQMAADAAMADAEAAKADADAAMAAADDSAAEAAAAQAKVDAMMADAYQPSEVTVSADMLDPGMVNLDQVQVSLAGPDSIYVSNIRYGGVPYSALLKYTGGTSATVKAVYGPMGKLIPDSVGLAQTELDFMAPASLAVSNVSVGGAGYSGTLEYAGGNQLRVKDIHRVTLPPTAAEMAQEEIVSLTATIADQIKQIKALEAALAAAEAATDAAMADADAAMAAADDSAAEATAAQAMVDAMMAAAYQPSEVMVSADMLDPGMVNLDQVQVSLAGPDSIYVSNIRYGGVPYSALLKYTGGTSATVKAVYGPMGKLIPDSVGLAQTELDFMAPASLAVSNVAVGGVGYSGTLEYAGGDQLRVKDIRRVTLPPTAAEAAAAAIAQAENDAAAAVSAAQAAADMAMTDAEAAQMAADTAMADADAAMADADAAMAAADDSAAEAAAAQAMVDAMMAAAYQPSEVMVSADMLDPGMVNLDQVQVSLAGPDSIYVSNIRYGGVPYSALLKYTGGTSATVKAVYGPMGKLIPDSVGLAQTELDFMAPASLAVSNVSVGGVGYSGTLEYAGGDQLRVKNIRRVTLPPTAAEAAAAAIAQAENDAAAAVSAAQAAADMAMTDAEAAQMAADTAMADADAAMADADAAMAAADDSAAEAAAAQAKVDAMMADAYQPSEVTVSADMLDPGMVNLDQVQVSLAGPDSIYVSNIRYGGVPYSALLKYTGGTSATVKAVYGPMGKLIPDSVGLAQTELDFMAPASLAVSNVAVGGVGYSGTLEYAGGDQLRVKDIRRVTLPPTAAEAAAAAIAQAENDAAAAVSAAQAAADMAMTDAEAAQMAADTAMADADAAMADADAAMAAADDSAAEAAAAQAMVDAMMAAAYQPSEVMVSADMLDPGMVNLDQVQVSLAGPDSIYVSNIRYGGVPYSALLKYTGGTSATVKAVYGPMGKLIPDSVGLAQTELDFMAPASLAVSNVAVGGVGYSGTLEYAGGDQLRVKNIRRVTLPPTAAEAAAAAIAQAENDAAAAVSAAQAAADMAMTDAEAAQMAADTAMADADAAMADADAAMAAADDSAAEAAAAQAKVDAMMADAYQPSEVMVSADMLDPGMVNLDQVQVSLAGPDSIYVSNIRYGGVPYSALLKYTGGTSATVKAVYGPMGKLIPDSVGLAQTELDFMAPASLAVSNVSVGGVGYSGTLEYAGGDQLRVKNIRRVTLPPTAAEAAAAAIAQAENDAAAAVSAAQAAADMAMTDAEAAQMAADTAMADADAAQAAADAAQARADKAEADLARLRDGIPLGVNPGLLNLESARLTVAGPNSIYISGVRYAGEEVSARVRYEDGAGRAEALFASANNMIDNFVAMDAAEIEVVGDALVMSNVGINGIAHTMTLTFNDEGGIDVAAQDNGWAVRTVAELRRDKLFTSGTYLVNGFAGGEALANEGSWSESGGAVVQTDTGASHAKYTIPASQAGSEMLFGVTASASGSDKVGFGLHLLASDTPDTGNTWNYGRSYLIWATRDPFYDTDATHLQFYESRDNNTLTWLASRSIDKSLTAPLTLETLYQHDGTVTLLVGGEEQLSLNIGTSINAGDRIALRSLGGPVEFTQVYVAAR